LNVIVPVLPTGVTVDRVGVPLTVKVVPLLLRINPFEILRVALFTQEDPLYAAHVALNVTGVIGFPTIYDC
jgi:hypothetical protein